ncbi:hypothetical protein B9J07_33110 [Sinorhizobium sp. LM21]|nr:hypothetical protein B9J07_33110 [Sinorhizobium sp. LM21]
MGRGISVSPGGYLRDLIGKRPGEFSLGPMLMALMRVKKSAGWKAG